MKFFLLFLVWTFIGSSYAAALGIWRGVECWRSMRCALPPAHELVCMLSSTVLAIFFAIFVVAMACDQYEGAVTNTTAIESMKSWEEQGRSLVEGLEEIFGEPISSRWLIPTPLPHPYRWSPLDDPDAYDPRDPTIKRHFKRIEESLKSGVAPNPPLPDESLEKALLPRLKADYLAKRADLHKLASAVDDSIGAEKLSKKTSGTSTGGSGESVPSPPAPYPVPSPKSSLPSSPLSTPVPARSPLSSSSPVPSATENEGSNVRQRKPHGTRKV